MSQKAEAAAWSMDLGPLEAPWPRGEMRFLVRTAGSPGMIQTSLQGPELPVGVVFAGGGRDMLRIAANSWLPLGGGGSLAGHWTEALADLEPVSSLQLEGRSRGMTVARVTLSDKGSRGEREDLAGPRIESVLAEGLDLGLCRAFLIPDNEEQLRALLVDLALTQRFNLVVTTGGTGIAPTDHTPEATLAVIEKRLPGFEQAMTAASLAKTPHGMLSRAVVGTLGQTLILNLPGSPKAVEENLRAVLPALGHGLDKLLGDPADCAALNAKG